MLATSPRPDNLRDFRNMSASSGVSKIAMSEELLFVHVSCFLVQVAVKYQNFVVSVALPGRHLASPVF